MGACVEAVRQRVWPWIDEHLSELVAEVAAVAAVPAPPYGEAGRADHLARRFAAIGLRAVERDSTGNVWAVRPAAPGAAPRPGGRSSAPGRVRPRLLLAAHLDTVFPAGTDVRPRRDGVRLHGPGVRDNSAGTAALIGLQRAFDACAVDLPGELVLAGTVGEEGLGNLRGMRALMAHWQARLQAVLVVDGDLGGISHVGVGSVRLAASLHCPGGHSWGDFGRPSAIHQLARAIVEMTRLPLPQNPRTTYNVGSVRGGLSINAIAPVAEMEIDLRSASQPVLDDLEARVRAILRRSAEPAGCSCEVHELGRRPCGAIAADHPLVTLARRAYAALGLAWRSEAGSTDANIPLALGLPAVCTGVSRGGGVHTLEEYLELDSLAPGLKLLTYLVASACEDLR